MSAVTESFSGSECFPGIVHIPAYEARGISKKRQQLTKISRGIGLNEYRLYAVIQYNNIADRHCLSTGLLVSRNQIFALYFREFRRFAKFAKIKCSRKFHVLQYIMLLHQVFIFVAALLPANWKRLKSDEVIRNFKQYVNSALKF